MGALPNLDLFLFTLLLLAAVQIKSSGAAEDAIAVGEILTGTRTKVSSNGIFKLGFFKLDGTQNWYAGIWYARVPQQTVAWVINAEHALQNNSASLNLTENGNLVLSYGGSVLWSTKKTAKSASSANITNEGNLAVFAAQNKSEIIWQSFDFPGNTWLPGMKIDMNQQLTAWKSPWDPTPGLYNLQLDADNNQFILVGRNSVMYWESGNWNGQIFSKVPEMTQTFSYVFSYFDNKTYKYFTYNVKPEVTSPTRFVMSESGDIKVTSLLENTNKWTMFWAQPRDQCQVYAVCGSFGICNNNNVQFCTCLNGFSPKDARAWDAQEWSSGCVRQTALGSCGNTSTDGFLEVTGKSAPAGRNANTRSASPEECRLACLNNCSCTAYAYSGNLCKLWFGDLLNLVDTASGSDSLFLRLAAVDIPTAGSNKKGTVAGAVGGAVGGVVAVLAIGFVIFLCARRGRSPLLSSEYPGSLAVYSYRELQIATKNFSERLGGGGFGSVFKGTLTDKTQVAVKKLEGISQGEKQFRMEVSTIGTIQHVNLVRLRGFCSEGSSRLLVYDYLPNGSLDKFLFSQTEGVPVLDWKTRFGIALGTAQGILYLHEKCRDCIIHCDIKPENILLDSDYSPKVADFGLAKLMGREFSHVLTTMRGTRGYLAPEWISGLPITPKADVYSFGMTLLEIIAGRRNMEVEAEASQLFFPTWAATQINQENTMALLDKKLNKAADAEQLKRAAMVGGWCIQDDEEARPSMSQVVQILEGIGDVSVPPIPRSLQALVAKNHNLVFYWDKETAPRSNTSSSRGSNAANSSDKGSENFSNSVTSLESSRSGSNRAT